MALPLVFSFWFLVAASVMHVIDESLLEGSFVEKVRQHWWREYSWTKFFWFNTGYFAIMIASILAYDFAGGAWLILPMAWSIERTLNGFWHVRWAVRFREYSPGLVTSILFWMQFYFILRYRPDAEQLTRQVILPAVATGISVAAFLFFYFPVFKGKRSRV